MENKPILIKGGLNSRNITETIEQLRKLEDKNLLVWFVVHHILNRINLEWESGFLRGEILEHYEKLFKDDIIQLIENINIEKTNQIQTKLEEIIINYANEFV